MRAADAISVGPYQILETLGRGSFGVVYKAIDYNRPDSFFALKLVPCDHLDARVAAGARDTALAEAQLLQRLRHPHVVNCHEVCYDERRHVVWLALDFLDGGDLQAHLDGRKRDTDIPFEATFVRQVLAAVGSALRYMHSQDVLHRDVKPSNILTTAGQTEIKLADFGISKMLETTGRAHTVIGTPPYMSPEIVCGEAYGKPADAWALGVCLYELLSLRRPFDASNQLALAMQIVESQPPALPPDASPDLVQTVVGLLLKDAQQRLTLPEALTLSTHLPPPPPFPPPCAPNPPPLTVSTAAVKFTMGAVAAAAVAVAAAEENDDWQVDGLDDMDTVHLMELPAGNQSQELRSQSLTTVFLKDALEGDVNSVRVADVDGLSTATSSVTASPGKKLDAFGIDSTLERYKVPKEKKSMTHRYLGIFNGTATNQEEVMPVTPELPASPAEGRKFFGFSGFGLGKSLTPRRLRSHSPPKEAPKELSETPVASNAMCSPRIFPWSRS